MGWNSNPNWKTITDAMDDVRSQWADVRKNHKGVPCNTEVIKSELEGVNVLHLAVKQTDETGSEDVFAITYDFSRDNLPGADGGRSSSISCRAFTESDGHGYTSVSREFLGLLSPTDNQVANNWREKCVQMNDGLEKLDRLFENQMCIHVTNGRTIVLRPYSQETPYGRVDAWVDENMVAYRREDIVTAGFR